MFIILIFLAFQEIDIVLDFAKQSRPLAAALLHFQNEHHILFTYEDPPYFPDNLIEYDDEVPHILVYRQIPLSLTYNTRSIVSDPVSIIEKLLAQYERAIDRPFFEIHDSGPAFHLIPLPVIGPDGARIIPILSHEITFPYEERSLTDTLLIIMNELTQKTGKEVGAGVHPFSMMANTKTFLGGEEESARSVLYRLLIDYRLTWYLKQFARGDLVVINIHGLDQTRP